MTDRLQVLHGPSQQPFKRPIGEKRRPCTWTLGAKVMAPTVDHVEALARLHDCKPSDILRTALSEFLEKNPLPKQVNRAEPLTAHQSAREAQINLGLIPTSNSRRNRAEPNRSPPNDNLNSTSLPTDHQSNQNPQIQTSPQLSPKTQRGGMKDTLNRL